MKAILALILLAGASFAFVGCESDLPPTPRTEGPIRRGLSGQGKIVPIHQENDAMLQETSGPIQQQ